MLVIVDGKRNDIASTAEAYASAYLGVTPAFGSQTRAFAADALTVDPYLGWDSLVPFARTARDHGNGLFLLVHTSNPSSIELQESKGNGIAPYITTAGYVARLEEEFSVIWIIGRSVPSSAPPSRRPQPQRARRCPALRSSLSASVLREPHWTDAPRASPKPAKGPW